MSFQTLNLILKIGKWLSVTPTYSENNRCIFPQRLHSCLMVLFYVSAVTVSLVYRMPAYMRLMYIHRFVQILLDGILLGVNIYPIMAVMTKKSEWCMLLENLRKGDHQPANKLRHNSLFVAANAVFCGVHTYYVCVLSKILGATFYRNYILEIVQVYAQFIFYFLLYELLNLLLAKYRTLSKYVTHFASAESHSLCLKKMNKVKKHFLILRETVDAFNQINGWPFLLVIAFTSLQIIVYLYHISLSVQGDLKVAISCVNVILWHSVGTFGNLFLCDAVVHEAKKIPSLVRGLERKILLEDGKGRKQMHSIVVALKNNFPVFVASRFFSINRAAVGKILNAVVTILVVMIQLRSEETDTQCQARCRNVTLE